MKRHGRVCVSPLAGLTFGAHHITAHPPDEAHPFAMFDTLAECVRNKHAQIVAQFVLTGVSLNKGIPYQFFTGTDLTCPMEQSARWVDYSPLGRFLHEFRLRAKYMQDPKKGFFDLGDIAVLVEPSLATWEVVACPEVNWDLAYAFKGTKGKILRCGAIDRDKTFTLLEERLKNR